MRTIREEKMARDLNLFPGLLARDAAHIARSKAKAQRVDEEIRRKQVAAAAAVVQAQKAAEREQEGTRFLLGAVGVCLAVIVALAVRLGMGM
jgi:hypothetical protein